MVKVMKSAEKKLNLTLLLESFTFLDFSCGPRGAGIRRLTGNRKLKATYTKREFGFWPIDLHFDAV